MTRALEAEEAPQGRCVDPAVDPAEQSEGLFDLDLEPRPSVDWVLIWEWLGPKLMKIVTGEVKFVDAAHLELLRRGRGRPHLVKVDGG
jgi:hypothetical protein